MNTLFAGILRRPITNRERIAYGILFILVLFGLRFLTPYFRSEVPEEHSAVPGFRIDDPVRSGLPQAVLHAETVLAFDPTVVQAVRGETFTLTATVDTAVNQISGAELYVDFDPTKLSLEQISAAADFSLVLQEPDIDNVKGGGSIALGVPLEQPTTTGNHSVAIFRFRALQPEATAEVMFSERSLVAADDEPGNVIRERGGARVEMARGK